VTQTVAVSGSEIQRAKLRANDRRREESSGHNEPRSSQVDAISGDGRRRPATVKTYLTSEMPVVRTHLRPPKVSQLGGLFGTLIGDSGTIAGTTGACSLMKEACPTAMAASLRPSGRAAPMAGPPALERHTVIGSLVRLTCVIGPLTALRAARSGMLICRIEYVAIRILVYIYVRRDDNSALRLGDQLS